MSKLMAYENGLNLKATELRLGLPGIDNDKDQDQARSKKRPLMQESNQKCLSNGSASDSNQLEIAAPPSKAQIVGWPPVQSFRRNSLQVKKAATTVMEVVESGAGNYVKVSMDGAPYLRKIDLSLYKGYPELLKTLEDMFKFTIGEYFEREGYKGSEYAPTYEDKDGDWMLVGDVPWEMFISSCKRLRIMKGSEARGLGCVA